MNSLATTCPQCRTALPADAPQGLCPACLLAAVALPTDAGPAPAPDRAAPLTPAELAPHFPQLEILECLGRGGMGVVYKARQKSLNRLVALKLLAPERVTDPGFADRFTREAQALARLSHPNIVTIHDFGVTTPPHLPSPISHSPFFFLLMEFVDGVNLRQAMKAGRFTPEQALAIVPPVCEALQYAHDHGIVHRDIKPENLLLDKNGRVKIADFGIAKMLRDGDTPVPATPAELGDKSVPFTLTAAGTPQYMAPEQREHHRTDHRADIYSLGVVLYELLTGELPGAQLQPPSRKVQIDVRLDEVVLRALETKPELRFATAAEFRTQLEQVRETPAGQRREDREEKIEKSQAPPPLSSTLSPLSSSPLKTANAYLSTPEWLASVRGKFWVYTGKGTLVLTGDQLAFTDTQNGQHTVIPLTAIRDVSLGNYPWFSKPAALHYVSVTWEAAGQTHRRYFTPNQGWFCPVWETNPIVLDWHQAIRAAVTAATGKAPAETPTPPHRPKAGELALMGLVFGMPVVLIGAAFFAMKNVIASAHGGNAQPTNWLLPGLALFAAIIPFLALLFLSRRSSQTSGTPPPPPHQPGPDPSIWTILLFSLPFAFFTIFFFSSSQLVAPPAPVQPGDGFIPGLLGLAVVIPFLTLYLLPRWGRKPRGSQPTSAPHKPPLWPNFALAAFGTPLLVHLITLVTGQAPPEPPHPLARLVFSLPGTLLLATFAGVGLWMRHRREFMPSNDSPTPEPSEPNGVASSKLAWVVVPVLIVAALLLLLSPNNGRVGILGVPEAIVLAVLGVLGWLRCRQRPAAPAIPGWRGRNFLGVGLICLGMFIGGLKIQEASRDHVQRVHWMAAEIPRLQQQWMAAGDDVSKAQRELTRFITQAPLARTDAERQRHAIEQGRLEGEVSKAKVRQDVIQGQIQTTQDRIVAMPFPFAETAATVLKWVLPFVLLGLLVLCWPRRGPADSQPISWKYSGLLMLLIPVLLIGLLALRLVPRISPTRSDITHFEVKPVGVSNHVVVVEVAVASARWSFALQPALTGPALSREAEAALTAGFKPAFATTLVRPTPHAANQREQILSGGQRHVRRLAFVLPSADLAEEAHRSIRPIGPLPVSPSGAHAGTLFTVQRSDGTEYHASIQVGLPKPAEARPVTIGGRWLRGATNLTVNFEVSAPQPGTVKLRREGNLATSSLQLEPKAKRYRSPITLELSPVGTNRVVLVSRLGGVTTREEHAGQFKDVADELMLATNSLGASGAFGDPIELCRVKGQPLTVTVEPASPRPAATGNASQFPLSFGFSFGFIALGAILIVGFGGVAMLVWMLRKGGASKRVVLLVFGIPLLLAAVGLAALIGYKATGGMSFEKFQRMQLHNDYQTHPGPNPPGRVQQTQNGFRLKLPAGQLATFELLLKQADDSLQPVPALAALVAAGTNTAFNDRLYWTLRRLGTENTSDYWSWSVTAHDAHGRALPQLTDHGTNLSHVLAPGETLDWWQLNLPTSFTFGAGEEKLIPLFRTHGTATTRGAHPKEAWLRVRCAALPTGFVTNGTPRIELGLAAHALLATVPSATHGDAHVPTHIEFKALRVENPPGTRDILLHFERDTHPGLGLEVSQDVTPSPGLRKQPAPGTHRDWQVKTWVGVNDRVLAWTLPPEFTAAEVRAVAKDLEQRAKAMRQLPDGAVPEFATAVHRDGWKYHLLARVLRTPGIANLPTSPPAPAPLIRREERGKTRDGRDVHMTFEELQRGAKTSTVMVKTVNGGSVGSAMFEVRGNWDIAKARGAAYFINLKSWQGENGEWMSLIGFAPDKNVDPKTYFDLKEPLPADKPLTFLSVAAYDRIFKDQP